PQGTSDVTSRLVGDSQNLQDGFKTVLGQSIQEPIKALFLFGLAMTLSWKLTLVIILFAPLMAAAIKKFGKKMRRASRAAMQRSSDMLGQIEGTLAGIRVVKSATAERFERRRYTGIMHRLREQQLKIPPIARESTCDRVTFSYPNAQQAAVESVSLTVPKGQSIAVVGRNGSGKTTRLSLLPRFYDPQFGRVMIDGVDVRDATLRSVR